MGEVAITFEKTLSLSDLQRKLANQEKGVGKLTDLGHTNESTIGIFTAAPPPATRLKLLMAAPGQQAPSGTKLCEGKVWITGQEQHVMAYRP